MNERIRKYGNRVGYTDAEMEKFAEGGHRVRQVSRLSEAAPLHSIEAGNVLRIGIWRGEGQ